MINELNEEIVQLTEKIRTREDKNLNLVSRRADAVILINMIAELCGFKEETKNFDSHGKPEEIYTKNKETLELIL